MIGWALARLIDRIVPSQEVLDAMIAEVAKQ